MYIHIFVPFLLYSVITIIYHLAKHHVYSSFYGYTFILACNIFMCYIVLTMINFSYTRYLKDDNWNRISLIDQKHMF